MFLSQVNKLRHAKMLAIFYLNIYFQNQNTDLYREYEHNKNNKNK